MLAIADAGSGGAGPGRAVPGRAVPATASVGGCAEEGRARGTSGCASGEERLGSALLSLSQSGPRLRPPPPPGRAVRAAGAA